MCLKQLKPFWKYFDKMVWAEIAVCMLSYADRSLLSICRGFKGHISRKTSGQDWIPIIHTYLIDIIPMGENKKIRIYRKSMNMFVKSLGSLVERPFICQNASPPCYIWLRSGFSPIVAGFRCEINRAEAETSLFTTKQQYRRRSYLIAMWSSSRNSFSVQGSFETQGQST